MRSDLEQVDPDPASILGPEDQTWPDRSGPVTNLNDPCPEGHRERVPACDLAGVIEHFVFLPFICLAKAFAIRETFALLPCLPTWDGSAGALEEPSEEGSSPLLGGSWSVDIRALCHFHPQIVEKRFCGLCGRKGGFGDVSTQKRALLGHDLFPGQAQAGSGFRLRLLV